MARRVNVHVYDHGRTGRSGGAGGGIWALLGGLILIGLLIKFWYIVLGLLVLMFLISCLTRLAGSDVTKTESPPPMKPAPKPAPTPDDAVQADIPLKFLAPDIAQEIAHRTKMMKDT